MAEPVLSATLLTPISIRLAWTYSGSADFEVFWKSDHPAGQEYVLLGRTATHTYDVGSLSWTTTYYFKVRAVSGATYGLFSDEMSIFICCGAAYVNLVPQTPNMWQQSIDIQGENIVLVIPDQSRNELVIVVVDVYGVWRYAGTIPNPSTTSRPWNVIIYGDRYYVLYGGSNVLYMVYNESIYQNSFVGYSSIEYVCVNSSGRVVVGLSSAQYNFSGGYWEYLYGLAISRNWGYTFEDPITVSDWSRNIPDSMIEGENGVIWFTLLDYTNYPTVISNICTYAEGGSYSIIESFPITATLSIDVDVDVIVILYYIKTGSYYDYYIKVSVDGGDTWSNNSVPDMRTTTITNRNLVPAAIGNGSIVIFAYNTTLSRNSLLRSTDNGVTWNEVLNVSTYQLPYPQYSYLRADGDNIVFTSCQFTDVINGRVGYLRSSDSGATWTFVGAPDGILRSI